MSTSSGSVIFTQHQSRLLTMIIGPSRMRRQQERTILIPLMQHVRLIEGPEPTTLSWHCASIRGREPVCVVYGIASWARYPCVTNQVIVGTMPDPPCPIIDGQSNRIWNNMVRNIEAPGCFKESHERHQCAFISFILKIHLENELFGGQNRFCCKYTYEHYWQFEANTA